MCVLNFLETYQLALVTPGNNPWWAIFLKQILQRPKSLWKPWGRPQILHLLCSLVFGYFPFAASNSLVLSLFIIAFLATIFSFIFYSYYCLFIPLKGIPINLNNSLASSSVLAVVIIETFIPFTKSTSS